MDNKQVIKEWNGGAPVTSIRMNNKDGDPGGNEDTIQRIAFHCLEHMLFYPKVEDADLEELFELIMGDYSYEPVTKGEQKYGLMLGRHFYAKGYDQAIKKASSEHRIIVSKNAVGDGGSVI